MSIKSYPADDPRWFVEECARREREANELRAQLGTAIKERDEFHRVAIQKADEISTLSVALAAANAEAAVLRGILLLGGPWPLREVFLKLLGAAKHLMQDHDCDRHGWEATQAAIESGDLLVATLDAALSGTAGRELLAEVERLRGALVKIRDRVGTSGIEADWAHAALVGDESATFRDHLAALKPKG